MGPNWSFNRGFRMELAELHRSELFMAEFGSTWPSFRTLIQPSMYPRHLAPPMAILAEYDHSV